MKNYFTLTTVILLSTFSFAQNSLELNLSHIYDGENFVYEQIYTDDQGRAIQFDRVQYYFSRIKITHDGGQETSLADVFVLTNGNVTNYELGNYNIDQIEKVDFNLGLDYNTNHGNSSNYPSQHPLGPQSPLMDWGWPSGYFFLVINGKVDSNNDGVPNKTFELQCYGDDMLTKLDLESNFQVNDGTLAINMNVNVEKWFIGIDPTSIGINHGSTGLHLTACNNSDTKNVFTSSTLTSISNERPSYITIDYSLSYAPTINYSFYNQSDVDLKIYNLNGQLVVHEKGLKSEGNYFIRQELRAGKYVAVLNSQSDSKSKSFLIVQ